jgi:tetratricopeptide (TPR) repeat protein
MKRLIGALLICAVGAMTVGCAQPPRTSNSVTMKKRAAVVQPNECFEKGDYDSAIAAARQLIAKNVSDTAAWYWLGAGQFMKRQYGEAIPPLNNVLKLAPNDPAWAASIINSFYYLGFCTSCSATMMRLLPPSTRRSIGILMLLPATGLWCENTLSARHFQILAAE